MGMAGARRSSSHLISKSDVNYKSSDRGGMNRFYLWIAQGKHNIQNNPKTFKGKWKKIKLEVVWLY